MANAIITVAIENELKQANVTKNEAGKFGGTVRNMDQGDPLMVGDVIQIPEEFDILDVVINPEAENAKPTSFIMVEVTSADGKPKAMRFFPNQLAKMVFPVDEDGKRLPKVKTTGTASKQYTSFQSIDEAMDSLKGKKIAVVKDDTYRTLRYGTNDVVNTHIYQYDLV